MTECERLLANGFITEDFLKPEVRCDYEIPTEMKKVWAIQNPEIAPGAGIIDAATYKQYTGHNAGTR